MKIRSTLVLSALNGFVLAVLLAGCSDGASPSPFTQSPDGEAGQAGSSEVGPKGDTGAMGDKGDKGDKGDTGEPGAIGEPGADGAPGDSGADGAPGAKGDTGDNGETGPKGDPGALIWSSIGVATNAAADHGYIVTASLALTLPASSTLAVGQEIDVIGSGGAFLVVPSGSDTFQFAPGLVASPWADRSVGNPSAGRRWTGVTSDASGQRIAAVAYDEQAWTSALGGAGIVGQPATIGGNNNFTSIASDASGANLVATVAGWSIWTSADYGVTWQQTAPSTPNEYPQWAGASSNADGTRVLVGNPEHSLYRGVKSNGTWTFSALASLGDGRWYATAQDASGDRLVAANWASTLSTSADGGATWTAHPSAGNRGWTSVDSSADGSRVFATSGDRQLWTGVNNAGTWTWQNLVNVVFQLSGRNFGAVSTSADGSTVYVISDNDVLRGRFANNQWSFQNLTANTPAAQQGFGALATNAAGTRLATTVGDASLWTYSEAPSALSVSTGGTLRLVYVGAGVFYVASSTGHLALQ